MLKALIKRFVGSRHDREAKRLQPTVAEVNRQFAALASLTDEQLRAKTDEFRGRIKAEIGELEDQVAALRDEKRRSEDPGDRERISLEISGLEKEILAGVEEVLDE